MAPALPPRRSPAAGHAMSEDAPQGWWEWARELVAFILSVSVFVVACFAVSVLYVRRTWTHVDSVDCVELEVVFVDGHELWRFHPIGDRDCQRFTVGDRWLISWNRDGFVKPLEKR